MMIIVTIFGQFLLAAISTIGFAVLFSAPKKELIPDGIVGGLGWVLYYVMTTLGSDKVPATIMAAVLVCILSRALAVLRRQPVPMFLYPGIFPLLPGAGLYYTAYYIFTRNELAASKGVETLEIAGAIAIGILIASALPQSILVKLRNINRKNN